MSTYVRPIAQHLIFPERFLLQGEDGRCYAWTGEDVAAGPEEIASSTASWLLIQRWMRRLPDSTPWVDVDDLPLVPNPSPSRRP